MARWSGGVRTAENTLDDEDIVATTALDRMWF
jgi:hypothetical protein